jgi:uncharacterized membrane protein YoaK (UPF0700 family)
LTGNLVLVVLYLAVQQLKAHLDQILPYLEFMMGIMK